MSELTGRHFVWISGRIIKSKIFSGVGFYDLLVQEADLNMNNFADMQKWLIENSDSYKGEWVVFKHGRLLDNHESRVYLHNKLKQDGTLKGSLFFKIVSD